MESEYSITPGYSHQQHSRGWLVQSRRPDAPERVVELLDIMERDYKRNGVSNQIPTRTVP
jgi:hypothetical protein